ncbi:MAG: (d)CMP kinase [Pseudolabrys sp.]|nr:(d)CMP kinase [Pseudolabrys sp.]MBV9956369.1 (d)CMP kinase [Pseudolabrys sp.]
MIIAIDGPAASGKGTLGRRLAAHYGYRHLDTGLLYRAVAKAVSDAGGRAEDREAAIACARKFDPAWLSHPDLGKDGIGNMASIVSAVPEVREALLNFQRDFARQPPGAVLDGRDIGTVICPSAEVKIFVTAAPEERARRRTLELRQRGEPAQEAEVLADILRRDERDRSRAVGPLMQAPDAQLLDTTCLDIEAALAAAVRIVNSRRAR